MKFVRAVTSQLALKKNDNNPVHVFVLIICTSAFETLLMRMLRMSMTRMAGGPHWPSSQREPLASTNRKSSPSRKEKQTNLKKSKVRTNTHRYTCILDNCAFNGK